MYEHFRYVSRSVGLLKRGSSLRKVVDRSVSLAQRIICQYRSAPGSFGKNQAYMKSRQKSQKFCIWGQRSENRALPAVGGPLPQYHYTTLRLVCQYLKLHKKTAHYLGSLMNLRSNAARKPKQRASRRRVKKFLIRHNPPLRIRKGRANWGQPCRWENPRRGRPSKNYIQSTSLFSTSISLTYHSKMASASA